MSAIRYYVPMATLLATLAVGPATASEAMTRPDSLLAQACASVAQQLSLPEPFRIDRVTLANLNPNSPGFSTGAPDSVAAILSPMRFVPKPRCECGHVEELTMTGPGTRLVFSVCDHCLSRYNMPSDLWRLLRDYAHDSVAAPEDGR